MSYTIDERNPERQQILARMLEPHTREVLARLPPIPGLRCLDLGCGQGNTTRLLSAALGAAECIGVEYDPAMVDFASTQPNPAGVSFQHGDVTRLAFADASFDVVFCRYLLIHLTDPMAGVREMMRVVRPGGYAVAFEGDFVAEASDPESSALPLINRLWNGLFQSPRCGRRLVRYFRDAGASRIQAGAVVVFEHDSALVKRTYRLTAEAAGPLARDRGILSDSELVEMIDGLTRLEEDPASVLMKFPDMWVIAQQ
ncbi:MAG TPA: methyltransferase domain-containing protein [Vicinamibacterales bacterium]|jgi:SAM-dependent methyltransferase